LRRSDGDFSAATRARRRLASMKRQISRAARAGVLACAVDRGDQRVAVGRSRAR